MDGLWQLIVALSPIRATWLCRSLHLLDEVGAGEVGLFCCDEHLQQCMVARTHAGYKLTLDETLEEGLAIFGPVFTVAACMQIEPTGSRRIFSGTARRPMISTLGQF